MLYDLINCPHRVTMDLHADPNDRDETSAFVKLLWEKGALFEKEVIQGTHETFTDLSLFRGDEKLAQTTQAMLRGDALIYSGRIAHDNLLGEPDLMRRQGSGYIAGDIKSGAGLEDVAESDNPGKPKKHYAMQLALYTDILEKQGHSPERKAFIWDINCEEVTYDFTLPMGPRTPKTLWMLYQECRTEAAAILQDSKKTLPAYGGVCKMCHWYSACMSQMEKSDDLTLIPELGRVKRDELLSAIPTTHAMASIEPQEYAEGKSTIFKGIGQPSLDKFHRRAKLITAGDDAKPYLTSPIYLPEEPRELFFDIEVDPMRDLCYLHGFIERNAAGDNKTEKFVYFFAEEVSDEAEKHAFAQALQYINDSSPCAIYYYSKYERTIYRKLQKKYPDVCTEQDIETLFDPTQAVDLYFDIVLKATEWPTRDYSIKSLAKYLGFQWRDTNPSGAASIEWFDRWIQTQDPEIQQRILDYNEDDCVATRVLKDGLAQLR